MDFFISHFDFIKLERLALARLQSPLGACAPRVLDRAACAPPSHWANVSSAENEKIILFHFEKQRPLINPKSYALLSFQSFTVIDDCLLK